MSTRRPSHDDGCRNAEYSAGQRSWSRVKQATLPRCPRKPVSRRERPAPHRARGVFVAFVVLFGAVAQTAAAQPARQDLVEVDPIRCWWRTSHGAVSVGQPFSVVLTCAVLENESVRVVPDESPLAVGTVQLAPFELLGGSHPADLRSGQRRFFQYDYNVRLIESTAIGRDVALPALVLHYRVESRLQAEALEGRDRTYILPAQSVHIMSSVPADAVDIRDAADAPFGAIEATRFRARLFDIASVALGALGVILLVPAAIRAMGLTRKRAEREEADVPARVVIGHAVSQLAAAQSEGRGGWTPDLLARALSAARLVAGYAIGRRTSVRALVASADAGDARMAVSSGLFKKRRVSVANSVTAEDLARALEQASTAGSSQRRALLEQLRDVLTTLTRAQYAQEPLKDSEIDEAVRSGLESGRRVWREHGWWPAMIKTVMRRS